MEIKTGHYKISELGDDQGNFEFETWGGGMMAGFLLQMKSVKPDSTYKWLVQLVFPIDEIRVFRLRYETRNIYNHAIVDKVILYPKYMKDGEKYEQAFCSRGEVMKSKDWVTLYRC